VTVGARLRETGGAPSDSATTRQWSEPWLWALCGVAAALLVVMGTLGMLSGAMSPDTAAYFTTETSSNPWGEIRHPLYARLATWLGGSATSPGYVAIGQALLHAVATLIFYVGARAADVGRVGAFVLAVVALFSQSGLYHLRLVLPEAPAIAFLLIAFGGTLAASHPRNGFAPLLLPIAIAAGLAYLLRPSMLPAIVALPALWWLFAARNRHTHRVIRTLSLVAALAAPFLLQSGFRQARVGDFNIVSFGGFQMSGMAGFMLAPEIVDQMSEPARSTARAVLMAREAGEESGRVARTPLNSVGERSFVSAALGYFDIYARSHDDLLYGQIIGLRAADETWVAFNRRLMTFSVATITAAPLRWIAWVVGATSRLVGRMIVTNATMLVALVVLFGVSLLAVTRRAQLGSTRADLMPVSVIALAWVASTAPLTVLVTFPATRYIDTAALLIAAPPLLLAVALAEGLALQDDNADQPGL
jgi:hypothetical protein